MQSGGARTRSAAPFGDTRFSFQDALGSGAPRARGLAAAYEERAFPSAVLLY